MKLSSLLLALLLTHVSGCTFVRLDKYPKGVFLVFVTNTSTFCEQGIEVRKDKVWCDHGHYWQVFEKYMITGYYDV